MRQTTKQPGLKLGYSIKSDVKLSIASIILTLDNTIDTYYYFFLYYR